MLKQIEGSRAAAEAVAMCRPQVICAYPITPQTHIVEALSAMVKKEELAAEFLNVESEFAAMSGPVPGVRSRGRPGDQLHHDLPPGASHRLPAHPGPVRAPVQARRKTEVIGRIQAAADRNIRRFGLAPLGTERAEVAVPG
jgi:hypothetical protein